MARKKLVAVVSGPVAQLVTLRKIINDTVETGSRIMDDSDRMELAIKNAVGKRLMYQEAKAS